VIADDDPSRHQAVHAAAAAVDRIPLVLPMSRENTVPRRDDLHVAALEGLLSRMSASIGTTDDEAGRV